MSIFANPRQDTLAEAPAASNSGLDHHADENIL
jgi:hypothetical protein